MNFNDLKRLESNFTAKPLKEKKSFIKSKLENDINKDVLNDLISSEEKKKEYMKNPLEYFYQDIISNPLKFDFKKALGVKYYLPAEDDALSCLEICPFKDLNPYKIHGWIMSAFKFIDHFVLHYIQDVKKDTPRKTVGDEMSRYIQLESIKGDISKAGLFLMILYKIRNRKLEHRTITFQNGKQELRKPDRKAAFKEIQYRYPEILKIFLKVYKLTYPELSVK